MDELDWLRKCLDSGTIKLIGVKAAGGFGKSALVAKFCEELTGWNVVWTTFSQVYPFAVWGRWLLNKLERPVPEKDDDLIIALCDALASGKYLLVWDNLETLLKADGLKASENWFDDGYGQFLLRWFSSQSLSKILVTSREQPRLPANTFNQCKWLALDGLSDDAGVSLLGDLGISGSDFDLEEFVKNTAGHPLLIKLVAGILHEEEGEEVDISALNQDIFQIIGLHRNDPEASISQIIDASIGRLRDEIKVFLSRLSVYLLPFDKEAAGVMWSNLPGVGEMSLKQVEDELRLLMKRCLLQESRQEKNHQKVWIFQFQPLIQRYLQQKISEPELSQEKQVAHQQAIVYYEKHRKPQLEFTDELEAVTEYLQIFHHQCELGNYLLAFNIIQEETNPDDRYSDCDSVLRFRGYNAIRLTLYERLFTEWSLEIDEEVIPISFINTIIIYGNVLEFLDRRDEALNRYQEALNFYRQIGDRLGEANTLKAIGDVLQFLKRSDEALNRYQEALNFYRQIGAKLGEANTLIAIGDVLQFLHRRDEALNRYQEALNFYRQIGAKLGEANTLIAIGDVLQFLDRRDEALNHYQEALNFYRQIGAKLGEANTLIAIGDVLQFLDRRDEALNHYQEALNFYPQIGDRLGEANTLQELGTLQSNPQETLKYLQDAQNLYIQIQDIYSQSRNLLFIANAQLKIGDKAAAISCLTEASDLASTINFQPLQKYAENQIAEIQGEIENSPTSNLWLFLRGLLRKRWLVFGLLFLLGLVVVLLLSR